MPFVQGYLRVRGGGHPDNELPGIEGPVDPGYGIDEGGYPDQGLPGSGGRPIDPGFGVPLPPIDPGYGLPGGGGGRPSHPIARPPRPTYPVDPDYGLPTRPGIWPTPPKPPGPVDPGYGIEAPVHPSHPIYPVRPPGHPSTGPVRPPAGGRPDQGLPSPQPPAEGGTPEHPIYKPGYVWPPLPPSVTGHVVAFCWVVGVGYRWVVLDCSGSVEHPIAPGYPGHPDQGLPPTAQPK